MRFQIEPPFWALFPEVLIGVVVARGVDNHTPRPELAADLAAASAEAAEKLDGTEIASHPHVAPWRRAYSAFGAKPSQYRSSIEALLRGALAGRLRSISPLVDLYNTISLRHALPCGGEDIAQLVGDLRLTRATGGELFVPLGATTADPPAPGEVIYRDEIGVVCRCWNWREAERTKLVETSTDAFLCIEALPEHGEARLRAAIDDLAHGAQRELGATVRAAVLHRENTAIDL
jgi:DNA/RNA-binding domain of Phe-tRNA-synthetase-like protein